MWWDTYLKFRFVFELFITKEVMAISSFQLQTRMPSCHI